MEINVTDLVRGLVAPLYSASQAELGPDAGRITWENACDAALPLFGDQFDREEFDAYFRTFGAWDDEELAAHTDEECAAIMLQDIAAHMLETDYTRYADIEDAPEQFSDAWWTLYESDLLGNSGALGRGDDDSIYYSIEG